MQIGACARTVHESNVVIALGLASKTRFPNLLKTLETKSWTELLEGTPVLCKQGVAGSIPVTSTRISLSFLQLMPQSTADFVGLFPERFGVGQFLEPALLKPGKPAKSARKRAPGSAGSSAAGERS